MLEMNFLFIHQSEESTTKNKNKTSLLVIQQSVCLAEL